VRRAILCVTALACQAPGAGPEVKSTEHALSAETRLARVTAIRDVAAGMGLMNGPLLAGIAQSETNMAHCWSEATWACQGPSSPSCEGGPVIAGAADGPCSAQQGGLGMYQFDAGTYADTLARDGEDILLLEGNIAKAVDFVLTRVTEEIAGAGTWETAIAWMNSIPMEAGTPLMEAWASMIVCRYNGCCSDAAVCIERRAAYRDNAIDIFNEYGPEFWKAEPCEPVPAGGRVLEERDGCYVAGGDPKYWRREQRGSGGASEWTMTTDLESEANYGIWRLEMAEGGVYRIEVHMDGGQLGKSKQARYLVAHAGQTDEVMLDQSAAPDAFVALGDFELAAGGDQYLMLGDNTGEGGDSETSLLFDAVRVTPATDEESGSGFVGGCSLASGGGDGGLALGLLALLWLLRVSRRRDCVTG
jgi:MYXO-CTERM domain-containing protein